MTFTSYSYLGFLLLILLFYYFLPVRLQNILLLAASCAFYWILQPRFLWLLLATGLFCYLFTRLYGQIHSHRAEKLVFVLSLILVLAPLIVFKYLGFFDEVVCGVFGADPHFTGFVLPLGISFYTFQTLGYMIDVHQGKTDPDRDIIRCLLFVSFFPQLMSGPIGRSASLMPQYAKKRVFNTDNLKRAAIRYLTGIFKKAVIADNIGRLVDTFFSSPSVYGTTVCTAAVIAMYALQIYFDFAGYSDMAIASAEFFGIHLPENFNTPYLASNISGFWKRWHMSLTGWLTEYIYIPLGGNRKGQLRKDLNILIVFLVSGLWHGAAYTFVVWGLLHGVFRVGEEVVHSIRSPDKLKKDHPLKKVCKTIGVFCLAAFAFLFFRAIDIQETFRIMRYLVSPAGLRVSVRQLTLLAYTAYSGNTVKTKLNLSVLAISLFLAVMLDLRQYRLGNTDSSKEIPLLSFRFVPALLISAAMYLALILTGVFGVSNFIYFQF